MGLLGASAPAAAGAFYLLETTVLTSSASSVTFSGLDAYSDYKHLQIRATMNNTQSSNDQTDLVVRFNSDTGDNYSRHALAAEGASVYSTGNANISLATVPKSVSRSSLGVWAGMVLDILDFSNTSKNTTIRALAGAANTSSAISLSSSAWYNTNAVTSIYLAPESADFRTGSRFSLYGVK